MSKLESLMNLKPTTHVNDHPQVLQDLTQMFREQHNHVIFPHIRRTCPLSFHNTRLAIKKDVRNVWLAPDRSRNRGFPRGTNRRIYALNRIRSRVLRDKDLFNEISKRYSRVVGMEIYFHHIDIYVKRLDWFLRFEKKIQYMWDTKDEDFIQY